MRIRKKWDLPSEQTGALAVLSLAFLVGGSAGCFLAALSGKSGAEELGSYLVDYLTLAGGTDLPRNLWTVVWGQVRYLLAALVLGLTALGLVGLPVLFGLRGFFFAFPVACFCRVFGVKGLFPAFILFFLPALLWAPALFAAGVPGFLFSQRLLRQFLGEGRSGFPLHGTWWCRSGLCAGLTLAAGLLEYWVIPVLLRAVAHVILS